MSEKDPVVIVGMARTPMGGLLGELASFSANELGAHVVKAATAEAKLGAAEIDEAREYPWDTAKLLNERGFMGMTIPTKYGGQGLGYLETTLVVEEMAKVCGVSGRIAVEANMGAIGAIMAYGTGRPARRRLRAQRPETLDHRRRRLAAASDFCQSL